jgi:hypothetical protein
MSDEDPKMIPDHHSPVRSMWAEGHGEPYIALKTLDDARKVAETAAVMEGDSGGEIYLTCPIRLVACSESALTQLLDDIDSIEWNDPSSIGLYYDVLPVGSGVGGGMGGGVVIDACGFIRVSSTLAFASRSSR